MVSSGKTVPDLHVPNKFFIVGEYEVQQNISFLWIPCHLEQEVSNNAPQELPGLFMCSYLVLCSYQFG